MTDWPGGMAIEPIGEWPVPITRTRQRSQFKASMTSTMDILNRELHFLGAKNIALQVAIPASQFRLDGKPRAQAKADHPGVILTLDSKHGPLSYPCDTYTRWDHNLRAIALCLEALRAVERHKVIKRGEQYRGSLAIEAPVKLGMSDATAERIIRNAAAAGFDEKITAATIRRAKFYTHPDTADRSTTDPDDYARVVAAEQFLTKKGIL